MLFFAPPIIGTMLVSCVTREKYVFACKGAGKLCLLRRDGNRSKNPVTTGCGEMKFRHRNSQLCRASADEIMAVNGVISSDCLIYTGLFYSPDDESGGRFFGFATTRSRIASAYRGYFAKKDPRGIFCVHTRENTRLKSESHDGRFHVFSHAR